MYLPSQASFLTSLFGVLCRVDHALPFTATTQLKPCWRTKLKQVDPILCRLWVLIDLGHVVFEDSVQVDTPALPGALTWIDVALDLGLLSMPDHVVVLQISARDARRRILGRDGGLWLANGELEFMEGFFTDLPTWFVERAAPPGCLHVVDWRRGMDVVAGLLDGAPTGYGSGQSGGLRSWQ